MTDNSFTFMGIVQHVGPIEQRGSKGYELRTVVVAEEGEKYPQSVAIEFGGKALDKPDGLVVGDLVTVAFNLKAREYNGRWYNSLNGWRIDRQAANRQDATPPARPPDSPAAEAAGVSSDESTLPF